MQTDQIEDLARRLEELAADAATRLADLHGRVTGPDCPQSLLQEWREAFEREASEPSVRHIRRLFYESPELESLDRIHAKILKEVGGTADERLLEIRDNLLRIFSPEEAAAAWARAVGRELALELDRA